VIDLGVLDNVIGVVVVILLLSMVVQSLQSFVKKLSKFKSRQIRKSLERLFEKAGESAPPEGAATASNVLDHFKELGRVTAMNRHAVESISKKDLSKVVTSIEASSVLPQKAKDSIASMLRAVQQAQQALDAVANIQLPADATANVAELRQKIAPLIAHVEQIVDASGNVKAALIVREVVELRDFPAKDVVSLISALQVQIEQAAAAAPGNAVLTDAAMAAKALTRAGTELQTRITEVVARLRERVDAIESWYDTVMQGFEERYARHMRTWAFILSLIVAVVLNADLAQIYKRMATDKVSQDLVVAQVQAFQQQQQQQQAAMGKEQTLQEMTEQLNDELDNALANYPALGLEPLDWPDWWADTTAGEKAKSAIGWLLMAFLLSLGAPFWHDTLESLFGLKNMIRSKGQIQNVEQRSGEGNVKS